MSSMFNNRVFLFFHIFGSIFLPPLAKHRQLCRRTDANKRLSHWIIMLFLTEVFEVCTISGLM